MTSAASAERGSPRPDRLKSEARREDLEFMARLTRETGPDSAVAPSLTVTIVTNVDPSRL